MAGRADAGGGAQLPHDAGRDRAAGAHSGAARGAGPRLRSPHVAGERGLFAPAFRGQPAGPRSGARLSAAAARGAGATASRARDPMPGGGRPGVPGVRRAQPECACDRPSPLHRGGRLSTDGAADARSGMRGDLLRSGCAVHSVRGWSHLSDVAAVAGAYFGYSAPRSLLDIHSRNSRPTRIPKRSGSSRGSSRMLASSSSAGAGAPIVSTSVARGVGSTSPVTV